MTYERVQFDTRLERTGTAALTMHLYGEFDLASCESFVARLSSVHGDGLSEIVIDLTELTFIDSSGISALVAAKNEAAQDGFTLSITLPRGGHVRRVLDLTGVVPTLQVGDGGSSQGT